MLVKWPCEPTLSKCCITLYLWACQVHHHPSKFDSYGHCSSGDIMVLACHVVLQYHVIIGSYDFMGSSPLRWATILPSLVVITTLVVEFIMNLVCHEMLEDHVIKASCDFIGGSPSWYATTLPSLVSHRHRGSGDMMFLVAEEENSRWFCFNPPLLFISKEHRLK